MSRQKISGVDEMVVAGKEIVMERGEIDPETVGAVRR